VARGCLALDGVDSAPSVEKKDTKAVGTGIQNSATRGILRRCITCWGCEFAV
jgi:hypothetical protein